MLAGDRSLPRRGDVHLHPFACNWCSIVDNNYIGRPVDVQPLRDGSLLISDDYAGAVYRVTYGVPRAVTR